MVRSRISSRLTAPPSPEFRVEDIAQPIADQIDRQHENDQGDTGKDRDPPFAGEKVLAADEIDATGVEAEPCIDVRAVIAVHPGHPLEAADFVSPQDLHETPFVALAPEDMTRREADAIFATAGTRPRIVAETPYSTTACALVLAGLGCGIVDPITAPGFLERGLILKPLDPPVFFRTLLLFPPDRRRSRPVREFVEELAIEKSAHAASEQIMSTSQS